MKLLELLRALLMLLMVPAIIALYLSSSMRWFVGMAVYVLVSTVVLLVLNTALSDADEKARERRNSSAGSDRIQ